MKAVISTSYSFWVLGLRWTGVYGMEGAGRDLQFMFIQTEHIESSHA